MNIWVVLLIEERHGIYSEEVIKCYAKKKAAKRKARKLRRRHHDEYEVLKLSVKG